MNAALYISEYGTVCELCEEHLFMQSSPLTFRNAFKKGNVIRMFFNKILWSKI
jgi:hypothetical protein